MEPTLKKHRVRQYYPFVTRESNNIKSTEREMGALADMRFGELLLQSHNRQTVYFDSSFLQGSSFLTPLAKHGANLMKRTLNALQTKYYETKNEISCECLTKEGMKERKKERKKEKIPTENKLKFSEEHVSISMPECLQGSEIHAKASNNSSIPGDIFIINIFIYPLSTRNLVSNSSAKPHSQAGNKELP
ncbi:hypothetical protein I7I50_09206 [Histoplasma capsulatum G186AR]|uniref:Uncharacterized protein n=1 Tax=Ajellomyces capsulatus TaxID=5037 RepID=A0A8H8D051_AJECA|nr:hypothetical protein I7I52_06727 [Histoplasma capsulatum]QSS74146.1 hypothetical protein I7I50_09206 [Histoplasma capsulatum G186AR]